MDFSEYYRVQYWAIKETLFYSFKAIGLHAKEDYETMNNYQSQSVTNKLQRASGLVVWTFLCWHIPRFFLLGIAFQESINIVLV